MGNAAKPEVTKAEIQEAQSFWVGFTGFMKWGVIATVAVLALLAMIFF